MSQEQINKRHKKLDLKYDVFQTIRDDLENYQFQHYVFCEQIGEGGFAAIYKGIDLNNDNIVGIKVIDIRKLLKKYNEEQKVIKQRLIHQQSRLMMRINSPYILKCFDCFQNEDIKIMIIQYCNQGTLRDKIDDKKKIPEEEAIAILKQIVTGLGECHKQKIIHRDLKPENILINNGECKIADFGFSKMMNIKNENEIVNNTWLGTITTMAPEVLDKKPYGLKADIWSIGVIFFNMIFGQCPFKMNEPADRVIEMMNYNFNNISEFNGVKPSAKIKKFLSQVLVVDIDKRLGWRELLSHELFDVDNGKLRKSFYRQVELKNDSKLEVIQQELTLSGFDFIQMEDGKRQEKKSEIKEKMMQKEKVKQFDKNNQRHQRINMMIVDHTLLDIERDKKQKGERMMMRQERDQSKLMIVDHGYRETIKSRIFNDDEQIYNWAKKIHFQCRITEFIYQNILSQVQKYFMFDKSDPKDRLVVQTLYLVSARCRNNISPIFFEYLKRKDNQIIHQLSLIVGDLYKKVTQKYLFYSKQLTKIQDRKRYIFVDFFSRNILSRKKYREKNRFLVGVQNMQQFKTKRQIQKETDQKMQQQMNQSKEDNKSIKINKKEDKGLYDYDKKQQILFTSGFLVETLQKMRKQQKFRSNIQQRFVVYATYFQLISQLKQETVKEEQISTYVARNILK